MRLDYFRAFTFDCYGTLIDWERGILGVLQPWAARNSVGASGAELLEAFAKTETSCLQASPSVVYPEILRSVMERIAQRWHRRATPEDAAALADSVGRWPPFADTPAALRRLRQWHKLVVVSNVDRASFARTAELLGVGFDGVVTAEEVGAYKPDARMFRHALEVIAGWGIAPEQVLHVAQSLYHDHVPAKSLGLRTVWVNRRAGESGGRATPPPAVGVEPDLEVRDLAELVWLEEQQRRA